MKKLTCRANAAELQRGNLLETLSPDPSDLAKCSEIDVPSTIIMHVLDFYVD